MSKKLCINGNAAAAYAMKQLKPEVVAAFPITPSTEIPEQFSKYVSNGEVDSEFLAVESEHSAMSALIGSSLSGSRSMTATSSNGLLYMLEMLYIAAGMRTNIVMGISTRAVSAPLNIHNDHSDAYSMSETGWIMLFSETNQEMYDNFIIGTKLAEKINIPVAICQDGFITSHNVTNMEALEDKEVDKFVGEFKRENPLLQKNPVTYGALDTPKYYHLHRKQLFDDIVKSKNILKNIFDEYEKISSRRYDFIEEYNLKDAENIIIVMGSTAGTTKEVVDELNANGHKTGLIKVRLFRPFPNEMIYEIFKKYKNIKNVAILDKSISAGSFGLLYRDIISSTNNIENKINFVNYFYGLGGKDVSKKDIEKIFLDLENDKMKEKIRFLGEK